MNKKGILVLALSLAIVGGTSGVTCVSASQAPNTAKGVVTAVNGNSINNAKYKGSISNDEAVKMAQAAMKNYAGRDASYFSKYQVSRSVDEKKQSQEYAKEHPQDIEKLHEAQMILEKDYPERTKIEIENDIKHANDRLVIVDFMPKNCVENYPDFNVFINEKTGEIVDLTAINYNLNNKSQYKVDNNKVKDATLNFLKKTGKKVKGNVIKVEKQVQNGTITVHFVLDDGRDSTVEMNPQDYSIVAYHVNFDNCKPIPSLQKETMDIQINK